MNIFDFNFHMIDKEGIEIHDLLKKETELSLNQYMTSINKCMNNEKMNGYNFMIFNPDVFFDSKNRNQITILLKNSKVSYMLTALMDFRRPDWKNYIKEIHNAGFHAIKFHAYFQKITEKDYPVIQEIIRYCDKNNIAILVCTSFGTVNMYEHMGIKLASFIAQTVKSAPIVLLHAGANFNLHAFFLADSQPNIYLDTSFSLAYLYGSSVEQDFHYIFQKLKCERIFFGTDQPYMSIEKSISDHQLFFEKYSYSEQEINKIMYQNAIDLIQLLA